jgi:hypothetical protein
MSYVSIIEVGVTVLLRGVPLVLKVQTEICGPFPGFDLGKWVQGDQVQAPNL